jgi:hypothetical protein
VGRVRIKSWIIGAAVLLGACAAANATTADAPADMPSNGWVQVTPPGLRIDGELFTPTCSQAPGTDPAYRFWFRQGTGDGLVIFFDGGGACWDDITCSVPRTRGDRREEAGFYKAELIEVDDPNRFNGVFAFDNPRNPLRDWTFVYVPYCTGDVHTGANTAIYTDPDTGEHYTIEHRGADNFRAILHWMRSNVATPRRLLVAGSSAGAYGASAHYSRIRDAFPRAQAVMIGDAGQGVATQQFLESRYARWRYDPPRSVFGRDAGRRSDYDAVALLAAHYPNDRFAQYTTANDLTQSGFYALMGVENACTAWREAMLSALAQRQSASNFRSYVAAGQWHSILRGAHFYSEHSAGAAFADWFTALVAPQPAPMNQACTSCDAAPSQRCVF